MPILSSPVISASLVTPNAFATFPTRPTVSAAGTQHSMPSILSIYSSPGIQTSTMDFELKEPPQPQRQIHDEVHRSKPFLNPRQSHPLRMLELPRNAWGANDRGPLADGHSKRHAIAPISTKDP